MTTLISLIAVSWLGAWCLALRRQHRNLLGCYRDKCEECADLILSLTSAHRTIAEHDHEVDLLEWEPEQETRVH